MGRTVNRLSALKAERLNTKGMHPDGAGLYLQVTGDGSGKSWLFRFSLRGRSREMGLGSFAKISLAEARVKASEYHKLIDNGLDPIEWRKQQRAQAALTQTGSITFSEAAKLHIASHRKGLRNIKYATQYGTTIATYAEPVLGKLLVRDIGTVLVMRVLEPIWTTRSETANKLRGRIERILDWARVQGYCSGENPARWKGHLDHLLPALSKIKTQRHHAAMPFADIPSFMRELRQQHSPAARALEFLVLTGVRSGEVLKAQTGEINREALVWTIPAQHTKTNTALRIPLCQRSLELATAAGNGFLFRGKHGGALAKMAMDLLLQRMGYRGRATPHGFRSTFRDWAAEQTNFPNHVVEMALGHAIGSKVEAAYRRGDLFDKRRRLMDAWAAYCASTPAPASDKVVPLRSA
jgi:integrase